MARALPAHLPGSASAPPAAPGDPGRGGGGFAGRGGGARGRSRAAAAAFAVETAPRRGPRGPLGSPRLEESGVTGWRRLAPRSGYPGAGPMAPAERCPLCRQTFFCGRGHVYSRQHQRQLKVALERLQPQVRTGGSKGAKDCGAGCGSARGPEEGTFGAPAPGPAWPLPLHPLRRRWRPPARPSARLGWSVTCLSTSDASGACAAAARCGNT